MQLERICFLLSILIRIGSFYFVFMALFGLKKPRPYPRCLPQTRFACLIAARNEEAVIGELVRSLLAQRYPAALFDVYVVPNNCTDRTEAVAQREGGKILHCTGAVRCKGDALHQAVEQLQPRGYDALCIFDADNVVDGQFLARMNDAFCAGARVAKSRLEAKNPYDSWIAGCYGIYFGLFNLFWNRARANLGLSAKLVGTGFAVHCGVLEQMGGWNTRSLAEDAEFAGQCALLGERVWWVPEAITYDEAPNSFGVSLRQRRRWCSGLMEVGVGMIPRLLCSLRRTHAPRAVDTALMYGEPYLQVFALAPTLLLFGSAAVRGELWQNCVRLAGMGVLALAVAIVFAAVVATLSGYSLRRIAKSLVGFPLFMVTWLPLQVLALIRPVGVWQEIRHSGSVSSHRLPPIRTG